MPNAREIEAEMGDGQPIGARMVRVCAAAGLALAGVLAAAPAKALDIGDTSSPLSVEVHAFASQGFIATTHGVNYLDTDSRKGSFQLSEVGINFTKSITDRLRMGFQLSARDFGPTGSYNVQADWFYLDYRLRDWLGVRAGRVKIPFGLYNELNDVDSGRVPILLPQSIYSIQDSNFLLAQTGGELYGYLRLGAPGALEYRLYGGTIFIDKDQVTTPFTVQSLTVPYVVGGRLMWESPIGLRAGGSVQSLRINSTLSAPGTTIEADIVATLYVASVEYALGDLLLSGEYSRWVSHSETSLPIPVQYTTAERWYVMGSYRVASWLQPGVYYAEFRPDDTKRNDHEDVQRDAAATLRFDLTANWLLKLEGHWMFGTAGLDSALNGGVSLDKLDPAWAAFLVKTTGYF